MRLHVPEVVPVGLAGILPQVPDQVTDVLPVWIMVAVVSIMATVTVLEKLGRLPGGAVFSTDDRRMLRALHGTVLHRRDDGVERFIYHGKLLEALAEAETEREVQAAKFDRTVALLVDQLRATNRSLDELTGEA